MKLILYQATIAITEIDFEPGPFRCQIEQQHIDFGVVRERPNQDGGWTRGPDSTKRTQLRERPNSRQEGPGQAPVQHGIQYASHHRGASLEKDMCAVTQYSRLKR